MSENVVILTGAIIGVGVVCQWLAWRLRLPAILFLLLAGIVMGPFTGILDPDAMLGDLLFPFVSLAVAVILFEGALTLKFSEIAGLAGVVRRLVITGPLITWGVVATAAMFLAGLRWELALLFGAVMTVTGPTVVVPMLRTVRPNARIANILRWEGIVIDPIGALLAVLVFEFVVSYASGGALSATLLAFVELIVAGAIAGIGIGYVLGEALRRDWLPGYLLNIATLAAVFVAFAASNTVADESGLLAVTLMGIYLGNRKGIAVEEILAFKESLSLILITTLFILLAARIDLADLKALGWISVSIFLVIQFIARPLKVAFATWGSTLSWRERVIIAWIGPRGIVAAAVTALFALRLEEFGYPEAAMLVPLTFVVIIGTVVLQSITAGPLARALKVAESHSDGFLILGANPLARNIAEALVQQKIPVMLTDTLWDNVSRARMAGLPAYYGNPLSEHAEAYLNTAGLGRLLALSSDMHLNELACTRFKDDFGAKELFTLRVGANAQGRRSALKVGREAFGSDASFVDLSRRLHRGAEIRKTTLSETFTLDRFWEVHGENAVPLFAVSPKGRVEVFSSEAAPPVGAGWAIVALIDPEPVPPRRTEAASPATATATATA